MLKGDNYYGRVQVFISLKKVPSRTLFLDFRGISIANFTINGQAVEDETSFRDHKIYLPTNLLRTDGSENQVRILELTKFLDWT